MSARPVSIKETTDATAAIDISFSSSFIVAIY